MSFSVSLSLSPISAVFFQGFLERSRSRASPVFFPGFSQGSRSRASPVFLGGSFQGSRPPRPQGQGAFLEGSFRPSSWLGGDLNNTILPLPTLIPGLPLN